MLDTKQCQKDFGSFIKAGREKQHLYQSQVASQLGITQQYYSQIENGVRNVDLVLAINICEVLGLKFNSFLHTYIKQ